MAQVVIYQNKLVLLARELERNNMTSVYDKYKNVEPVGGMSKKDHDKLMRRGDRDNYFIKHGTHKGMDKGLYSAKSKALEKKKGSADHINAERKRQGYKPMSAQDKRIHEGMDKYL